MVGKQAVERPAGRTRRIIVTTALSLYYLAYAAIFAGWLFHRSRNPALFTYSRPYIAFLVVAAIPFFLPPVIRLYAREFGPKRIFQAVGSLLVVGLAVYLPFMLHFYYTQEHRFDPFLQMPPTPLKQMDARSNAETRILALGGSTTFESNLSPADRYPAVLEKLLRERYPDDSIRVFNGGMDWYTTKHTLINYVTNYARWDPDIVIIMHAVNDLYRSFASPWYTIGPYNDAWTHFYGPAINGARPGTFEGKFLRLLTRPWFSRLRVRQVDFPLDRYRSLGAFERYLTDATRRVRDDGHTVLLMTQPFLYKDEMTEEETGRLWLNTDFCVAGSGYLAIRYASPRSMARAMRAFNAVTKKVAETEGVPLIDAESLVPKTLDYFLDDVHYTPRGAKLVAEAVARTIIENELISRP